MTIVNAVHVINGALDMNTYDIQNTLPGKSKMCQDILEEVRRQAEPKLDEIQIRY